MRNARDVHCANGLSFNARTISPAKKTVKLLMFTVTNDKDDIKCLLLKASELMNEERNSKLIWSELPFRELSSRNGWLLLLKSAWKHLTERIANNLWLKVHDRVDWSLWHIIIFMDYWMGLWINRLLVRLADFLYISMLRNSSSMKRANVWNSQVRLNGTKTVWERGWRLIRLFHRLDWDWFLGHCCWEYFLFLVFQLAQYEACFKTSYHWVRTRQIHLV